MLHTCFLVLIFFSSICCAEWKFLFTFFLIIVYIIRYVCILFESILAFVLKFSTQTATDVNKSNVSGIIIVNNNRNYNNINEKYVNK